MIRTKTEADADLMKALEQEQAKAVAKTREQRLHDREKAKQEQIEKQKQQNEAFLSLAHGLTNIVPEYLPFGNNPEKSKMQDFGKPFPVNAETVKQYIIDCTNHVIGSAKHTALNNQKYYIRECFNGQPPYEFEHCQIPRIDFIDMMEKKFSDVMDKVEVDLVNQHFDVVQCFDFLTAIAIRQWLKEHKDAVIKGNEALQKRIETLQKEAEEKRQRDYQERVRKNQQRLNSELTAEQAREQAMLEVQRKRQERADNAGQ